MDGQPYQDPEFAEAMERYHEAALEAHRAHARVDLSMPVPALVGAACRARTGSGNGHVPSSAGLPQRPDVEPD